MREVVLALLILLFVKPILAPLAYAAVLSVALYPAYEKHRKWYVAALLILLAVVALLFTGYQLTLKLFDQITWLNDFYSKLSPEEQIQLIQLSSNLPLQDYALRVVTSIPSLAVDFVLFVIFSYFLLVDGWRLKKAVYNFLPKEKAAKLVKKGWYNLNAVVMGFFVSTFVYLVICTSLLYFTGSPSPLVVSILAALFGILPVLGAWMALAYPVFVHLSSGNYVSAIIIVAFQLLWNSAVDFYFKARYRGTLHPAVLLGSMAAGIKWFGFSGIVIGPLLATAFETVMNIEKSRIDVAN